MKTRYNCSVIILIILIISFLDHFFPDLARADVLINEVLAANSSINLTPDHAGFNDWLELYNSGTSAYDLTDHFLSDDLAEPHKWQIDKGTVIGAGGFLLFFADAEDEDHHTNFKLDKKGGVVALFDPGGNLVNSVALRGTEDGRFLRAGNPTGPRLCIISTNRRPLLPIPPLSPR